MQIKAISMTPTRRVLGRALKRSVISPLLMIMSQFQLHRPLGAIISVEIIKMGDDVDLKLLDN